MLRLTWQAFLKGEGAKHPSSRVFRAVGGKTPSETARGVKRYAKDPDEYLQDLDELAKMYKLQRRSLNHDTD